MSSINKSLKWTYQRGNLIIRWMLFVAKGYIWNSNNIPLPFLGDNLVKYSHRKEGWV